MIKGRKRETWARQADGSPSKRLRGAIRDSFMQNRQSATELGQLIIQPLTELLPDQFGDFRTSGISEGSKNSARDLRRNFLKACKWPSTYLAKVRTWCPKTASEVVSWIHILLPHEMLAALLNFSPDRSACLSTAGLDHMALEQLRQCERDFGQADMLGIGLWTDGVPNNFDRSDSVELIQVNMPGLAGEFAGLRVPVTAFPKSLASDHTYSDCLEIVRWSFQLCVQGCFPNGRHDNSPFLQYADQYRRRRAGKPLGFHGCLVMVRGDWSAYKNTFGLPGWNENAGCCWLCKCTPDEARMAIRTSRGERGGRGGRGRRSTICSSSSSSTRRRSKRSRTSPSVLFGGAFGISGFLAPPFGLRAPPGFRAPPWISGPSVYFGGRNSEGVHFGPLRSD